MPKTKPAPVTIVEAKTIHLLFTCNAWKEYSSMRLACASTTPDAIDDAIVSLLEDGSVEFAGVSNSPNPDDMIRDYRQSRLDQPIEDVVSRLLYAHYVAVENGELQ